MPTLHLDLVKGSELEATQFLARYVRMGYVDNIDLSALPDPEALVKVLTVPGFPAMKSQLGPQSPGLRLSRVRIVPQLEKVRRVVVALTYETLPDDLTPTVYMLRDRTFIVNKTTCFIPGTRTPVIVGFTNAGTSSTSTLVRLAPEVLFFSTSVSARSIQITSLMYGRPDGGAADYVNYVNDADWPGGDVSFGGAGGFGNPGGPNGIVMKTARSKPKGYWKLSQYGAESNQNGTTLVQAEAISQVIEDWSEVAMLRNEKTGKFPFASLPDGDRLAIMTAMLNRPYAYGDIYPTGLETNYGIKRFGPCPLTGFVGLMGF